MERDPWWPRGGGGGGRIGGNGSHQPNEAAQDEGEDITDLDAQLPSRGHDDGITALSPAQVGLLGLQVMDDGCQIC